MSDFFKNPIIRAIDDYYGTCDYHRRFTASPTSPKVPTTFKMIWSV